MLYNIIDLLATILESTLVICSITFSSEFRFAKKQETLFIVLSILGMTLLVSYANTLETFSFFTILLGTSYAIAITKLLSKGKFLLRTTVCILTLFFLHSFDAINGFSCALIFGQSESVYESYIYIMQPGTLRILYTAVNKSIQIVFCFILWRYLPLLNTLGRRSLLPLCSVFFIAYVIMSILLNLIISDSLIIMQVAVIFAWIFILICMIAVLFVLFFSHNYYQKKQESEVLAVTNQLMEKNYKQLYNDQTFLSQQMHDFTNHLRVISSIVPEESSAAEYVNKLLSVPYKQANQCHSGNEVIDAVINCKQVEADALQIQYSYKVQLSDNLSISSTDICAILSNQIDNALEACEKIADASNRWIHISIGQKNDFILFKVENTAPDDPFKEKGKLVSKKNSKFHGLGIKNISETVKKYDGSLTNEYNNHIFTSIAMIQNLSRH